MAIVIFVYDQLLFRPIVAWADKLRFEQTAAQQQPRSWIYDLVRRARLVRWIFSPVSPVAARFAMIRLRGPNRRSPRVLPKEDRIGEAIWLAIVSVAAACALWFVVQYLRATLGLSDVFEAVRLGFLTLLRVVVVITLASVIWVPIGVWIGLRPWAAERG